MSSFELIAQELLKQQQQMQRLEAENRELRQQLMDLRAGHGIFIEIEGQRFPLEGSLQLAQPVTVLPEEQEYLPTPRVTTSLYDAANPVATPDASTGAEDKEEETALPVIESSASEAPTVEIASTATPESKQEAPAFLEEILLDEFAAAATSPIAVWNGPIHRQETSSIDEEQKAVLRRELMDSFILE